MVPLLPRNAPSGDSRGGRRCRPGPFRPHRPRLPGGGRDSAAGPAQDPVGGGPAARLPGDRVFPIRHPHARRDPTPPGVARRHPLSARRRGRGALPEILLPPAAATDLRRTVRPPMGAGSPAGGDGAGGGDSASVGPRDRRRDQAPASVRTDRGPATRGQRDPERPREAAPDAPAPAGGRGQRQDDRRLDRGDGRLAARRAGRGDGAHGDPGRAALPEIPGPVRGTAGPCRSPLRRAAREGAGVGSKADPGRGGGHRRGNARPDPGKRRVPEPCAGHHRRAAPVRGASAGLPPQEGKDLPAPPRHDRHADPADAGDRAVRRPRRLGARRDASRKDSGPHEGRHGGRSHERSSRRSPGRSRGAGGRTSSSRSWRSPKRFPCGTPRAPPIGFGKRSPACAWDCCTDG